MRAVRPLVQRCDFSLEGLCYEVGPSLFRFFIGVTTGCGVTTPIENLYNVILVDFYEMDAIMKS